MATFVARGRGNDDRDVIACREALGYWRRRRLIDAEREQLALEHIPALVERSA
jgi:hypothetical protein